MRCEDNSKLRLPLREVCQQTEIGSVPVVSGEPTYTPTPDQLPLAYNPTSGMLYIYAGEWRSFGLRSLQEINVANTRNLDSALKIPVIYSTGNDEIEGYITLKEFKSL